VKRIFALALALAVLGAAMVSASAQTEALGTENNPIVWVFVPSGETQRVTAGADSVVKILHDKTGLFIKAIVATDYPAAIEALAATPPKAQMASLATFAAIMAGDAGVAKAALISVRNGSAMYNGQIIANATKGIKTLADLKGKTFARVDTISTSGWIIPMITLRANGIDAEKDMKVVDAGSHDAVVAAVYAGDVDAGACYVDARTRIQKDKPDVMEKIIVLNVSAPIPNDGVQFSPSVPADVKEKIVAALLDMLKTDEGKTALNTAYQWTGLERHDDSFYDPFRQVLQAAGMKAAEFLPPKK
jgi:phosphonate transport system substrate-binding protein